MAGKKPKTTAGNPSKRKLNKKEPILAKGMPEYPKWLFLQKSSWGHRNDPRSAFSYGKNVIK